jgi:phosphoribosylformylglycinamidine cyclo-ligase
VIRDAYRMAGVDVEAGDEAVARIRQRVESTFGPEVLTGLGSFAAAVGLPAGLRDPVLVAATDGVGTKTALAAQLGRYNTVGIDLVAMCADDVVCLGARPLFFLDYVALERLDPAQLESLVDGIVAGCLQAGCALVGGETAEHPGLLPIGSFDLAGFCVGIAERGQLFGQPQGRAGDALIGIAASGLHSNGFSLVRRLIADHRLDLHAPFAGSDASLGEQLLTPTHIYAPDLLALRSELDRRGLAVRGFAHITGGGLSANVVRALRDDAAAIIDPDRWPMPPLQDQLARLAGLEPAQARAIWNGGIGMVAVVESRALEPTLEFLRGRQLAAWHLGEVVGGRGQVRYQERAGTLGER